MRHILAPGFATLISVLASTAMLFVVPHAQAETSTSTFELPITAGHMKVSGALNYYRTTDKSYTITFTPGAEYFLIDRLSVGLNMGLTWYHYESNYGLYNYSYDYNSQSLGPSVTWYFAKVNQVAFFFHQTAGYTRYSDTLPEGWSGTTGVGESYFFNPNVALSAEASSQYGKGLSGALSVVGAFNIFF